MCTSGNIAKGNAVERTTWDQISRSLIMASPPIDTSKAMTRGYDKDVKGWGWCVRE